MRNHLPALYSDLDGTALRKYGLANPRNWAKYPLPETPGYENFVRGVAGSGVAMGRILSMRPDIWPRRLATNRSMRRHELAGLFPNSPELLGSEEKKALRLVHSSIIRTTGMIDDHPERIGTALIDVMRRSKGDFQPILLGAVACPQTHDRFLQLMQTAWWEDEQGADAHRIEVRDFKDVQGPIEPGKSIFVGSAALHVVELPPYSAEAGQAFGDMMLQLAA